MTSADEPLRAPLLFFEVSSIRSTSHLTPYFPDSHSDSHWSPQHATQADKTRQFQKGQLGNGAGS